MDLLYKDNKLYMYVTSTERINCLPYIYGAKLDALSGTWVAAVGALLPILTVFPTVNPKDKDTEKLIATGKEILNAVKKQKDAIKTKQELTSKDYPFLMSHQVVCNNIAKIRPRYAFFLDTGTRQDYCSIVYYSRYNKQEV